MELKIGQLANLAGVNVQTVRYYERFGLLPAHSRSKAGYRYYTNESLKQLSFILKAKALGFSLKEIQELLTFRTNPQANCQQVWQQAKTKQTEIHSKIIFLQHLDQSLGRLIKECENRDQADPCPIITTLEVDPST